MNLKNSPRRVLNIFYSSWWNLYIESRNQHIDLPSAVINAPNEFTLFSLVHSAYLHSHSNSFSIPKNKFYRLHSHTIIQQSKKEKYLLPTTATELSHSPQFRHCSRLFNCSDSFFVCYAHCNLGIYFSVRGGKF